MEKNRHAHEAQRRQDEQRGRLAESVETKKEDIACPTVCIYLHVYVQIYAHMPFMGLSIFYSNQKYTATTH